MKSESELNKSLRKQVKESLTGDSQQTSKRGRRFYLVLLAAAGLITGIVRISISPPSQDWIGLGTSEQKSQVTIEEVNGKVTKTITTTEIEPSKTLWDWMSLLLAPATLVFLGFLLQSSQDRAKVAREKSEKEKEDREKERAKAEAQVEKEKAEDRQREDSLEAYLASMSDLLVGRGLSAIAKKNSKGLLTEEELFFLEAGMDIIRARTQSILRRLTDRENSQNTDATRKASVLLFLYETELIKRQVQVKTDDGESRLTEEILLNLKDIDLSGANLVQDMLRGVNLRGVNLRGADLREANLIEADLTQAHLSNTDLGGAKLGNAKLTGAIFSNAHLNGADLIGADLRNAVFESAYLGFADLRDAYLRGAILLGTNLRYTKGLTQKQLEGEDSPLLCNVVLPKKIPIDPHRDCNKLPEILCNRFPETFKTIENAKAYLEDAIHHKLDLV